MYLRSYKNRSCKSSFPLKKRQNLLKLFLFCFLIYFVFPGLGRAGNNSDREILIKIALSRSLQSRNILTVEFPRLIRDAGQRFRSSFGIKFKVKEIVFWKPESIKDSLLGSHNDLRRQVGKTGNDIVIGVISPNDTRCPHARKPGITWAILYTKLEYFMQKDFDLVLLH